MFYYEKRDETTGMGPYIKYGKKGKTVNHVLDLGGEASGAVQIVRVSESQRKFRINTKSKQLVVKSESLSEC